MLQSVSRPADETPDQRRTYEQACVAALQRRFEHDRGTLFNGRRVTGVELRGDYPDTEVVVTFVEPTGVTESEAFDIWRSDPPGDITDENDPGLTADLMWVGVAGM
jgi:hypothetical protein